MQKILVMNDFDIAKRPRPARLLQMLKGCYDLYAIAPECSPIEGVKTFSYPAMPRAKDRSEIENQILQERLRNQDFLPLIFTPQRLQILEIFKLLPKLDFIFVEDITLLAFGWEYKKIHPDVRLIVDLREFYPLEYESPEWLATFGRFFAFLCETYLKHVDLALCVSEGIARRYEQDYQIQSKLFYSLPPFFHLTPSTIKAPIGIIYHGFLSQDRNSEILIELSYLLKPCYQIFVMGLSNQPDFLQSLKKHEGENLRFIPPVRMDEIIPFTQQFDLGILTLSPNSFNNANALPNKFFEYIQARLGIITTPIPSLKGWIDAYGFGRYAKDFSPGALAELLNSLSLQDIQMLKNNANTAAHQLNLKQNQQEILRLLASLK